MGFFNLRWLVVVLVGCVLSLGAPGKAHAFDLPGLPDPDDIADWFDECNLGKIFGLPTDGKVKLGGADFDVIGNSMEFGECSGEIELQDFWLPEDLVAWMPTPDKLNPPGTYTSGKLVLNIKRRYQFKLGDAGAWLTGPGGLLRWKKNSKSEYYKGRHYLVADITSGKIAVTLAAKEAPNTSSMTYSPQKRLIKDSANTVIEMGVLATGSAPIIIGVVIENVVLDGYNVRRYNPPYAAVPYVVKDVRGKAIARNSAGQRVTINVELNKLVTRSVPAHNKLHQHMIHRKS